MRGCLQNERGMRSNELGQIMGHFKVSTGYYEKKLTGRAFIQHHKVGSCVVTSRLASA